MAGARNKKSERILSFRILASSLTFPLLCVLRRKKKSGGSRRKKKSEKRGQRKEMESEWAVKEVPPVTNGRQACKPSACRSAFLFWHSSGAESEGDSCSATLGGSVWTLGSFCDLFLEVSQPLACQPLSCCPGCHSHRTDPVLRRAHICTVYTSLSCSCLCIVANGHFGKE